jgi:hypothetical protein
VGAALAPIGRFAKTDPIPPAERVTTLAIGMWQRLHSSSIASAAPG